MEAPLPLPEVEPITLLSEMSVSLSVPTKMTEIGGDHAESVAQLESVSLPAPTSECEKSNSNRSMLGSFVWLMAAVKWTVAPAVT